jgi:predicted deacetylase
VIAVALHDVEPRSFKRCAQIRDWLALRGVDRVTLLVIPAPRLHPFDSVSPELADWLRGRRSAGDCVAQHGLRHLRTQRTGPLRSLHAALAGGPAAEFAGLDADASAATVDAGRAVLGAAGLSARGFVAPAYLYTPALRSALPARFDWWADRWTVHTPRGRLRAPALCLGSSTNLRRRTSPALVRALARLARSGPLRLDVHPADFDRPRHVAVIERVLDQAAGRECATYADLASGAGRRTAGGAPHPRAATPSAGAPAEPPRRREWSA